MQSQNHNKSLDIAFYFQLDQHTLLRALFMFSLSLSRFSNGNDDIKRNASISDSRQHEKHITSSRTSPLCILRVSANSITHANDLNAPENNRKKISKRKNQFTGPRLTMGKLGIKINLSQNA
jgi:hypothetical protein